LEKRVISDMGYSLMLSVLGSIEKNLAISLGKNL